MQAAVCSAHLTEVSGLASMIFVFSSVKTSCSTYVLSFKKLLSQEN